MIYKLIMYWSPVFSEFDNDLKSFILGSKLTSPLITKEVKQITQKGILSGIFSS